MASFKYIVPALAVAGRVAAQTTTSCSAASTFTIQNGGDAMALTSCSTFSGSIALATGFSGSIALDGVKVITGGFEAVANPNITSLEANDLQTVMTDFKLDGLTGLTTLSMPSLYSANSVDLSALPLLSSLTMNLTMTDSLTIVNTGLTNLEGIDLATASTITISDNGLLKEVNMQLGNISDQLTIASNGVDLVANFPNLIWANTFTVRNASSVSIPSLANVNTSLGFYTNSFESLSAPNLTSVGATAAFVSNDQLSNLSLPLLTVIGGGLQIANNSALSNVDGFPELKNVFGAALLTGEFKNVSLPSLAEVQGQFTLLSTEDIQSECSHLNSIQGKNNVIRGSVICNGGDADAANSTTGTGGSGTSSGSSASHSPSTGAAANMILPTSAGVFGLLAVIFGML